MRQYRFYEKVIKSQGRRGGHPLSFSVSVPAAG
jgi:hypothetical protein